MTMRDPTHLYIHMFEDLLFSMIPGDETDFMSMFSIEEDNEDKKGFDCPDKLPLLALKNTVLFPGVIIPITVGRDRSVAAINKAYKEDRLIGVLSQKEMETEEPKEDDLYKIGTIAKIVKVLRLPDGTLTAILQGKERFVLDKMLLSDPMLEGSITLLKEEKEKEGNIEIEAILQVITERAEQIIRLSPNIPSEASMMFKSITNKGFKVNFIASNLRVDVDKKQEILSTDKLYDKAHKVLEHMDTELKLLKVKDKIENKVRGDIEKQQKDYFLNQQLKTIQEELGQSPNGDELDGFIARAKEKNWDEKVQKTFEKEMKRIKRTNPQAAEYSVLMNWAETMLDLPWEKYTEDNFDLKQVKKVLDADHFGLEKVKDRIIEHLAVLKLRGDMKSPILCLVGPPGVGKTSLGKSIAKALGREYIRMSLGGLHDESEIRGHRKTYIGAMPGRIIKSLKKAGSSNPVFILDEIDKVGKSMRGDPSAALLEVLDPEQNTTFHDNYLELEYDLSKVLFIATSNSLNTIQPALLDRMEIIQVSGYSMEEKVEIAKRHLVPESLEEHGLKKSQVKLSNTILMKVAQEYTRESGVRSLKRQIDGIMRHHAKKVAMDQTYDIRVKYASLKEILGPKRFSNEIYNEQQEPGVAVGLAWTSVGGEILFIETSLSKGKGGLTLTGNLGDVMKESASTALSFIKANANLVGLKPKDFEGKNIHIHVPEGAIPKDGPSAGITMMTALVSAFTEIPIKSHLAMTGEITLRGKVLPVGGIKEKILAAKRAGLTEIILCKENEKHIEEIEESYIKGMKFHYVDRMVDVLKVALGI
jgi:ATP-dependent Lon protease